VCQLLRNQLAQLLVNQRQKLLRGMRIALLDGGQDTGNLAHQQHIDASRFSRDVLDHIRQHGLQTLPR
jgi:hypothetical protein